MTEKSKESVKLFCDQIFQLYVVHRMFTELFHSGEARYLMERTAHRFFRDLNDILLSYFILESSKITDKMKTGGSENLTVEYLVENIPWCPPVKDELLSLKSKIDKFRQYILPARHKLVAHTDRQAIRNTNGLGSFPEGEDIKLLATLQEFCNIAHKECFGEIYGKIIVNAGGDVHDLLRALRGSLAFEQLFKDATGNEKAKLFSLAHDINIPE